MSIVGKTSFFDVNDEITDKFSKYFEKVVNDLDLYEFSSCHNGKEVLMELIVSFQNSYNIPAF